jgi:hypothetical protein
MFSLPEEGLRFFSILLIIIIQTATTIVREEITLCHVEERITVRKSLCQGYIAQQGAEFKFLCTILTTHDNPDGDTPKVGNGRASGSTALTVPATSRDDYH